MNTPIFNGRFAQSLSKMMLVALVLSICGCNNNHSGGNRQHVDLDGAVSTCWTKGLDSNHQHVRVLINGKKDDNIIFVYVYADGCQRSDFPNTVRTIAANHHIVFQIDDTGGSMLAFLNSNGYPQAHSLGVLTEGGVAIDRDSRILEVSGQFTANNRGNEIIVKVNRGQLSLS